MTTTRKCPQCGAEMAETTEGLCPTCLMKQAMASPTIESSDTRTISPEIGTKVRYFGDYELLHEIARGGMGVIYKARQASLNRVVALKMILSGQLATEAEVKRFHTEAEAAANLQHPNIVAIHEVGIHDGRHYFTMDFVEGRNLAQVIGGQPLPAQRAAQYAKTIAEAIHFAHQRGTLHRDLKPQNVMIDTADHVRITDFGLAKQLHGDSSLTRTGAVMGSPNYMPPEQAQGRQDLIGPHSDVYAVGAMLYEMLTGRPPFLAENVEATLMKVVRTEPTPPRKSNANVPVDLETICLKCLEKSPQRRYATARELAEDLGRYLKQEPILARPISTSRKVEHWFKQHPFVLAALGALVTLALAFVAFGLWEQNRYLVWTAAHPSYVRTAGPRTAWLKAILDLVTLLLPVLMWAPIVFKARTRGLKVMEMIGMGRRWTLRPICNPPSSRGLTAYGAFGVGAMLLALYLQAKVIDVWVWEGWTRLGTLFRLGIALVFVFAFLTNGFAILMEVAQERRAQLFGRDVAVPPVLPQAGTGKGPR